MILLLDNYDSFTYNLAQYLGELGCEVEVHRNDKISVEEIARKNCPSQHLDSHGAFAIQRAVGRIQGSDGGLFRSLSGRTETFWH